MKNEILVIEDNEQNMYMITYLLKAHGYGVIQAGSGREGIDMAVREKPDLIILDIQLPDMDGYAIAEKLKANQACAKVPIVAVTSYAMVGDREHILKSGCNGYIEKPINPETFVSQLEEHLPYNSAGKGGEI